MITHFKRLAKQILVYGLGDALNQLIAVLVLPIFTRFLSPADFGVVSLLTVSTALILNLSDFGLVASIFRFFKEEQDLEKRKKIIATAQIFMVSVTTTIAILAIPFSGQISQVLLGTPNYSNLVILSFLTIPLNKLVVAPLARVRVEEKATFYVIVNISRAVATIALNLFLIIYLNKGLLGYFEGPLIIGIIYGLFIGLYSLKQNGLNFSRPIFKKIFLFGAPLILNSISLWIINWADRFIISKLTNLTEVGLYTLGYNFGMAVMLPIGAFTTAWMAFYMTVEKEKNACQIYSLVFTYYSLIIGFFALIIAIFGRDYFNFFTKTQFHTASIVIPLVALAYVFRGNFSINSVGAIIKKRTILVVLAEASAMVINIMLMFLLIPHYGRIGAAWATLISYGSLPVIMHLLSYKLYPITYDFRRISQLFVVGLGIFYICDLIYQPNWINLAVRLLIICLYPVLLYILGFFKKEELDHLKQIKSRFLRVKTQPDISSYE